MSQHPNERDAGIVGDEPTGVLATDIDDRLDVYPSAGVPSTDRPAPSVARPGAGAGGGDGHDGDGKVAQVKDSTKEAGQHMAGVAKDQAGNVAAEARSQAEDLLGQGRDQLREQAAQQQDRLATGLQSLSRELSSMADSSMEQGLATDLARQASHRAHSLASWLESREPGQVIDEVRSFARERPGAFLGLAAAAGVLAGRLGRGLKEGEPQEARHLADPGRPAGESLQPVDPIAGQY
ncbi:MAG: hypothetical protein ACJ71T_07425 [Actinomycetales bacterium]